MDMCSASICAVLLLLHSTIGKVSVRRTRLHCNLKHVYLQHTFAWRANWIRRPSYCILWARLLMRSQTPTDSIKNRVTCGTGTTECYCFQHGLLGYCQNEEGDEFVLQISGSIHTGFRNIHSPKDVFAVLHFLLYVTLITTNIAIGKETEVKKLRCWPVSSKISTLITNEGSVVYMTRLYGLERRRNRASIPGRG